MGMKRIGNIKVGQHEDMNFKVETLVISESLGGLCLHISLFIAEIDMFQSLMQTHSAGGTESGSIREGNGKAMFQVGTHYKIILMAGRKVETGRGQVKSWRVIGRCTRAGHWIGRWVE